MFRANTPSTKYLTICGSKVKEEATEVHFKSFVAFTRNNQKNGDITKYIIDIGINNKDDFQIIVLTFFIKNNFLILLKTVQGFLALDSIQVDSTL